MLIAFLLASLIAFGSPFGVSPSHRVTVEAAAPPRSLDIASSGVALGGGWYPLETDQGRQFRWVNNDATFTIKAPTARLVYLTIAAEGGPGLGTTTFPLRILDPNGRQVDAIFFSPQQQQDMLVLPVSAGGSTFKLHIDGGGKRVGADPRILNFRVFRLTFPGTQPAPSVAAGAGIPAPTSYGGPDISANGVSIGEGWYPLEHFKGDTFRWVDNNAQLILHAPRGEHGLLKLSVQTGPGMSEQPFTLFLKDGSGHAVGSAKVKDLSTIFFIVDLHSGKNLFVLHADGGGKPAPNDARTLNFRVLHVALAA